MAHELANQAAARRIRDDADRALDRLRDSSEVPDGDQWPQMTPAEILELPHGSFPDERPVGLA